MKIELERPVKEGDTQIKISFGQLYKKTFFVVILVLMTMYAVLIFLAFLFGIFLSLAGY